MSNPWEYWSAEQIIKATRVRSGFEGNVAKYWPDLYAAFDAQGIAQRDVLVAALATIAVEVDYKFAPIEEYPNKYWDSYDGGPLYHGRGWLQLTHKYNYAAYGNALGIDLLNNPGLALDPNIASRIMAKWYSEPRGLDSQSIAQEALQEPPDWRATRQKVNGGYSLWDDYISIIQALDPLVPNGASTVDSKYVFPIPNYTGPINLHWGQSIGIGASDLFAARGTPVVAISSGIVEYAGTSATGGHHVGYLGDDRMDYYYAHGDRPPLVKPGQRVQPGTYFFGVGDSGNAAGKGTHLHIGVGFGIGEGSGVLSGAGLNYNCVAFLKRIQAFFANLPPVPTPIPPVIDTKDQTITGLTTALAHISDVIVPDMVESKKRERKRLAQEVYNIREQFIGPRPTQT